MLSSSLSDSTGEMQRLRIIDASFNNDALSVC